MDGYRKVLCALLWSVACSGIGFAVPTTREEIKDATVSYVMEPFENVDSAWFINFPEFVRISDDRLFGESSLNVTNECSFGWILATQTYNCMGAQQLSLWSKSKQTGRIKLTLYDDSECILDESRDCISIDNLKPFVLFDIDLANDVFKQADDWQETLASFSDHPDLAMNRIRGWRLDVVASAEDPVLIDHLSCIDQTGQIFGNAWNPGVDFSTAEEEFVWSVNPFRSAISAENTALSFLPENNHAIEFVYTVEMVEPWGGFVDSQHLAAGAAYFNLTEATDLLLSYTVTVAADIPDRAIMRLLLQDFKGCTVNCASAGSHERFYSFHAILDEAVEDEVTVLQLTAARDYPAPFQLPDWSGTFINGVFDLSHIKGYTLEVVVGDQLGFGNTVSGSFTLDPLKAVRTVEVEIPPGERMCVKEDGVYFLEAAPHFTRVEFLSGQCCERCSNDPECFFFLDNGRDCFFSGENFNSSYVELLNTERELNTFSSYWMNTFDKRGEFCTACSCEDDTIDCRGYDLLLLPKTFIPPTGKSNFIPRVLDLRENPRLFLLGLSSLDALADDLEEIWLPNSLKQLSMGALESLPNLQALRFESDDDENGSALLNAIRGPDKRFGDVCCTPTENVIIGGEGLSFCDMIVDLPGIDAVYESFIQYVDARVNSAIRPDSVFLAEAAESPQKCAEYCTIIKDCNYFGYDARIPNAQHVCHLYEDKGTRSEEICCFFEHYADEAQTLPGWTSGRPAQTRVVVDNARVISSPSVLQVNSDNNHQAALSISLGSSPLRGAVWISPKVVSQSSWVEVTFSPSSVVLYDNTSSINLNILVDGANTSSTIVFQLDVKSCDTAFMILEAEPIFLEVSVDLPLVDSIDDNQDLLLVLVPVLLFVIVSIGCCIFLWHIRSRKQNDAVWLVKKEDLHFGDPAEVLGRGTFGLVLLAEYRGTEVAVKRAIPPRRQKARGRNSTGSYNGTTGSMMGLLFGGGFQEDIGLTDVSSSNYNTNEGLRSTGGSVSGKGSTTCVDINVSGHVPATEGSESGGITKKRAKRASMSGANPDTAWKKLKADFIEEMRYISKLRHPCITTVMGAVIDPTEEPMLVMEYMSYGSLYDLLHNETMEFEGGVLLSMLRDVSQGVRFLHSAEPQVIHGDLKAANVLVDKRLRAKVADFGLSQKRRMGAVGTPFWMAPELLRNECTNSAATDIYSIGIILYEVFSRKDPYEGEDAKDVLRAVADPAVNKRPGVPPSCPTDIASLMGDCLQSDPEKRPTSSELDTRIRRIDEEKISLNLSTRSFIKPRGVSLDDMFPAHIAKALGEGRKVEAEHHDMVTIFFSDIVNFTPIAAALEPRKVADLLDRLYFKLDALSSMHDVFKVETIGDAYMAVTNLVKNQSTDHVKRIAEFAIEAVRAANETLVDPDDETLGVVNLRIGFHSGPVVSDVVGQRSPRYCLFGDTVNTAARMESNSKKNRIQCSKISADLLRKQCPKLKLFSRGLIPIKGKGDMHTYWVNRLEASDIGPFFTSPPVVEKLNSVNGRRYSESEEQAPPDELIDSSIPSGEGTSEAQKSTYTNIPYGG